MVITAQLPVELICEVLGKIELRNLFKMYKRMFINEDFFLRDIFEYVFKRNVALQTQMMKLKYIRHVLRIIDNSNISELFLHARKDDWFYFNKHVYRFPSVYKFTGISTFWQGFILDMPALTEFNLCHAYNTNFASELINKSASLKKVILSHVSLKDFNVINFNIKELFVLNLDLYDNMSSLVSYLQNENSQVEKFGFTNQEDAFHDILLRLNNHSLTAIKHLTLSVLKDPENINIGQCFPNIEDICLMSVHKHGTLPKYIKALQQNKKLKSIKIIRHNVNKLIKGRLTAQLQLQKFKGDIKFKNTNVEDLFEY